MAGLPWQPQTIPSSPTTNVCDRPAYSAVVKIKRTASPQAKVLPVTKPEFHYDESDTQAWPTLSSASATTLDGKECSRKKPSNRNETVVTPTISQAHEEVISDVLVLAADRGSQASMSPPPGDTVTIMAGATLTGKKKRRRKSSKATLQVHSGSDQTAAGSTSDSRRLSVDVVTDHTRSEIKEEPLRLTQPQLVMPQLSAIPITSTGCQLAMGGTVSATQLEKSVLHPQYPLKLGVGHSHELLPSNLAPFSPPAYHSQKSQSSNISEQPIKKTQRVTPPPGMESTTNEIVRYRTKYIGLLRDEESEHEKQLYRIT